MGGIWPNLRDELAIDDDDVGRRGFSVLGVEVVLGGQLRQFRQVPSRVEPIKRYTTQKSG